MLDLEELQAIGIEGTPGVEIKIRKEKEEVFSVRLDYEEPYIPL